MIKKEGIEVAGHIGTWYVIDETTRKEKNLYLLESEQYGDEAACLIVDQDGKLLLEDVWNGFDDYDYAYEEVWNGFDDYNYAYDYDYDEFVEED